MIAIKEEQDCQVQKNSKKHCISITLIQVLLMRLTQVMRKLLVKPQK